MSGFQKMPAGRVDFIACVALIVAVFAAYANVYGNEFLLDDFVLIVQNEFLRSSDHLRELLTSLSLKGANMNGGFFRPVQMFLFFLVYQVAGASAAVFHGVNVVLQALCACLVYRFGRKLGWGAGVVFPAALIWAVHPLHTEAITCISGSADPLYVMFTLAGLLTLLPDFTPLRVWASCLFFALALLSKESAVVFPALATFTLFLVSDDRRRPAMYLRLWPLWLLMAGYLVFWKTGLPVDGDTLLMHDPNDVQYDMQYTHNVVNRLLTSLATIPTYLQLLVWPVNLHMERSFPVFTNPLAPPVLAGGAAVLACGLLLVWGRGRRGLAFGWGCLWFAASFSPYTGILKPINAFVSEHWMYMPSIGLSLGFSRAVADGLARLKASAAVVRGVMTLAVLSVALASGAAAYRQNRVWHDAEAFYNNIFDCGETSGRAHSSLAQYYFNTGAYDKAREHYLAALESPAPLWRSKLDNLHLHLAFIYLGAVPNAEGRIGLREVQQVLRFAPNLPEGVAELEKAVDVNPEAIWPNAFLALIYDYKGDKEKTLFYNQRVDAIMRSSPDLGAL